MTRKKPEQKLVSFTDNPIDLEKITDDMNNGWSIISLVKNGSYYVGIMELNASPDHTHETLFIPPRKKLKISV